MTEKNVLTAKQLLTSGIICLILGIAVVVFFVLPAEMNEDPTGFGEMTGLDTLAATEAPITTPPPFVTSIPESDSDQQYVMFDPQATEVIYDEWQRPVPALDGQNHKSQAQRYKTETVSIQLELDEMVEYKALVNQGDAILYSWVSNQPMYTDFHAHQDTGNPDFFSRYSETESSEEHGAIVAPYTGQHGWFWLNIGDGPATIELTVTGYFDEIIEIDMSAEY